MSAPLRIGRYVLYDEIASGGMAQVHLGRLVGQEGFARTVAIKRLRREVANGGTFRSALLEEARLAARIRHPNVVAPLDVVSDGHELLLVMEYVHGESLARLLRATAVEVKEQVPLAIAAAVGANLVYGLDAAHEARDEAGKPLSIVHRDVSPQNVIVGVDGIARVIDFGIAKAATTERSTTTGTVKGKLPYLAPEQLEGEEATRRTDVYAAGVVLWELLVGRRLFHGRDDAEILQQIVHPNVPAPSTLNRQIPASVDAVVLRMLERDPSERFARAWDAANALETVVELATPAKVSAWVNRLAAHSLAERARVLAAVEASAAGRDDELTTELFQRSHQARSALPSVPVPSARVAKTAPLAPSPSQAPPVSKAPPPPPSLPAATRPLPAASPASLRPPDVPLGSSGSRPPRQRTAGIAVPSTYSRRLPYLVFALVAAALIFAGGLPWMVRTWLVSAARSHAISLRVDRVELAWGAIRLSDIRAESAAFPGGKFRARAARIGIQSLHFHDIAFDDVDLQLDGTFSELNDDLDKYRAAQGSGLDTALAHVADVNVTTGRVDAAGILGQGSGITFENATLDMHRSRSGLAGDVKFACPLTTVRVGSDQAGPWSVKVERTGLLTSTQVRFDPFGNPSANATVTEEDDGTGSIVIVVPSMRLAELHIARGGDTGVTTSQTRIDMHIDIRKHASEGKAVASGRALVAIGNIAIYPSAAPIDVAMDIALKGEPPGPLLGLGNMTIGRPAPFTPIGNAPIASGAVTGELDIGGLAMRSQLVGETGTAACPKPNKIPSVVGARVRISGKLDRLDEMTLRFEPATVCAAAHAP